MGLDGPIWLVHDLIYSYFVISVSHILLLDTFRFTYIECALNLLTSYKNLLIIVDLFLPSHAYTFSYQGCFI